MHGLSMSRAHEGTCDLQHAPQNTMEKMHAESYETEVTSTAASSPAAQTVSWQNSSSPSRLDYAALYDSAARDTKSAEPCFQRPE